MEPATQFGVSVLGPERPWINLTGGTGVRFSSLSSLVLAEFRGASTRNFSWNMESRDLRENDHSYKSDYSTIAAKKAMRARIARTVFKSK
jgi:hypothetical protein